MSKKEERKMTQGGRIKRKRRKVRITRYARSERQTKIRMTRQIWMLLQSDPMSLGSLIHSKSISKSFTLYYNVTPISNVMMWIL